jgi:hypothetical protein
MLHHAAEAVVVKTKEEKVPPLLKGEVQFSGMPLSVPLPTFGCTIG